MRRRTFLISLPATGLALAGVGGVVGDRRPPSTMRQWTGPTPTRSIIPVVADGKWIWSEPPEDQTGYLEPREFEVSMGILMTGTGDAMQIAATTVVPCKHPEQQIGTPRISANGCRAAIRHTSTEVAQLVVSANSLRRGQRATANVTFPVTLYKQYQGYEADQFHPEATLPRQLPRTLLASSPGISLRDGQVRRLAREIAASEQHAWDKARRFYEWVWNEIKPQVGEYTSVSQALKRRVGDCEERAAVFVAFCRSAGIPARLVWVPNHNWAEFGLNDLDGQFHWIPVHTAAYSWFGWTGAHELVLQKGDSVTVPELRRPVRLVADWFSWQGRRPEVEFTAEMKPAGSSSSGVAGPGTRRKEPSGEWALQNLHPADRYMRR